MSVICLLLAASHGHPEDGREHTHQKRLLGVDFRFWLALDDLDFFHLLLDKAQALPVRGGGGQAVWCEGIHGTETWRMATGSCDASARVLWGYGCH